jgi:lipid-binding SYLF domain-containing protein
MRTFLTAIVVAAGVASVSAIPQQTQTQPQTQPKQELTGDLKDAVERVQKSTEVFNALAMAPDAGIPADLLARAEAVIVIPSLMKGGFIIGAKHGKGIVSVRRTVDAPSAAQTSAAAGRPAAKGMAPNGWSGPAFVKLTGGTIGWQIGLQSVDLVLLVMNRKGIDDLIEDRFTVGGSLSLAAGPVGRSGNAATNISADAGILGYSRAKGLFAGATLEGAALRNDDDENEAVYGKGANLRSILLTPGAKPAAPLPAQLQQWQDALARLAARK